MSESHLLSSFYMLLSSHSHLSHGTLSIGEGLVECRYCHLDAVIVCPQVVE